MRVCVLCLAAVAAIGPVQAFVGNGAKLPVAGPRNGAAPVCSVSMAQDDKMGRRAALWTTLVTGSTIASKGADAAGLNLMPPALKALKDGADERNAGTAAQGSKIPKFEAPSLKFEAPSFTVPKLGPQKKSNKEAGEAPAEKPKSRMTMPKLGQKAKSKEPEPPMAEAEAPAPTPVENKTSKPRKVKQAGMSGKEDERFKSAEVDSLEQKLLKKKLKTDEQLEEIKSKVGDKSAFETVPSLNPFGK